MAQSSIFLFIEPIKNFYLKKRNEELYDKYGDSYILDTNAGVLREFLNEMENDKEAFEEDDDLRHLKKKLRDKIIVETPVFEYFPSFFFFI